MIDLSEALTIAADHFPKGPEAVAARMGIKVSYKPLSGCAGWCLQNNNVAVITINQGMPGTRQRFTLAHELAHLLLGFKSEVRSDTEYFGSDDGEEKAADQLAAELLLPRSHIERLIQSPPVEASTIQKIANKAHVSQTMAACRITGIAQSIGLINAAVVSFESDKVKWVWSKTLNVPHDEACKFLREAGNAARGVYRVQYRPGETVIASIIGDNEHFEPHLFIQLLPTEIGAQKNPDEILAELGIWLFGTDNSFRGQVNGCLSSFKRHAEGMECDAALDLFNQKYLARWTGDAGNRIRDPRGQRFLRLRIALWCK